jgi:PHD/YefM family antitoxin component YafN of YafNO toxin-antitoxin module
MNSQPKYIVDGHGKRQAVILDIDEYKRLLDTAEEQLDAADLEKATQTETDFVPYDTVREDLRDEGKL